MNCNHDLAALRDHLCCDCIIEHMYGCEIKSIRDIMRGGALNRWAK
jgi:hypothetical protein